MCTSIREKMGWIQGEIVVPNPDPSYTRSEFGFGFNMEPMYCIWIQHQMEKQIQSGSISEIRYAVPEYNCIEGIQNNCFKYTCAATKRYMIKAKHTLKYLYD